MLKVSAFVFLFTAIHSTCFATVFSPLSFEKQIEEATSAVEVKLSSSRVFKNESNMTMTEYSFDVLESYNLAEENLDNQKLKLSILGGTYNGITSMIDGAPRFTENERTFLLLKKIDSKIYLSNFTLGKYKIQNIGGKTFYLSEVFPGNSKIGKIAKDKMIELMREKWKVSLMVPYIHSSRAIASKSELFPLISRVHASARGIAQEEVNKDEGVPFFFWSAIVFFVFFFGFIFFKLGKTENKYKNE
jgi:hypothetical protein